VYHSLTTSSCASLLLQLVGVHRSGGSCCGGAAAERQCLLLLSFHLSKCTTLVSSYSLRYTNKARLHSLSWKMLY
jgi:hypothetical protein